MTTDQAADFQLRPFQTGDTASVLALNAACQPEVGLMDSAKLTRFVEQAPYLKVVEDEGKTVVAFLVGLTEDVDYASPNFGWFVEHMDSFAYIDRIAVAEQARGAGIGPMLYHDFEAWAASVGRPSLCAEVNVEPPNPRSVRFHEIFGFSALEEVEPTGSPDYRVVMLEKRISKAT